MSQQLIELIRFISKDGVLLKKSELPLEQLNIKDGQLEKILEEILTSENSKDLKLIIGEKDSYLYSNHSISDSYAKMLFALEEKNIIGLISEIVREDSQKYPRPTPITLFKGSPFNLHLEEIENILSRFSQQKEFLDIKSVSATNGAMYLYSELFMTAPYAKALCQWIEVEQYENP